MEQLLIEAKEDSPHVLFDPIANNFLISGESRPENAGKFYTPIINWLIDFEGFAYCRKTEMKDESTLFFVFNLEYFNSTSAKYILDLLLIIKKFETKGYNVNIKWHYDKFGDDILDSGKELSEMTGLNFELIQS